MQYRTWKFHSVEDATPEDVANHQSMPPVVRNLFHNLYGVQNRYMAVGPTKIQFSKLHVEFACVEEDRFKALIISDSNLDIYPYLPYVAQLMDDLKFNEIRIDLESRMRLSFRAKVPAVQTLGDDIPF